MGLLFGPGVAVFGIAAVWFYTLYRLDRGTHARIIEELKARREAAASLAAATPG